MHHPYPRPHMSSTPMSLTSLVRSIAVLTRSSLARPAGPSRVVGSAHFATWLRRILCSTGGTATVNSLSGPGLEGPTSSPRNLATAIATASYRLSRIDVDRMQEALGIGKSDTAPRTSHRRSCTCTAEFAFCSHMAPDRDSRGSSLPARQILSLLCASPRRLLVFAAHRSD